MRFGYVGSPCVESVVRGFLCRKRTLSPYSSMIRQNRSRPIGLPYPNSVLYICQSFIPPIPGLLPALPVCTGAQTPPWQPWPAPRLRRIGNRPAWLRQTVHKGTRRGSVSNPLHAGSLLLGASFFSYRNPELGLGNAYQFVIGFRLDLCLQKLFLQFLDLLLKFSDFG